MHRSAVWRQCRIRSRWTNDSEQENPLVGLLALTASFRLLKNHRACFFFLDAKHLPIVDMFIRRYTGFVLKEYLVWDKRRIGMGQGYRKQHEMIVALEKGKPAYNSAGFPNVLSISRVRTAEHPHKKARRAHQAAD